MLNAFALAIVGGVVFNEVIEDNEVQFWKTLLPIDVTELPMVTLVKTVQESNALIPIEVTELGMVTEVNLRQAEKAL